MTNLFWDYILNVCRFEKVIDSEISHASLCETFCRFGKKEKKQQKKQPVTVLGLCLESLAIEQITVLTGT